jgi:hypothetical protein
MKHKDDPNKKTTEYIYLSDDYKVMYSSRNEPMRDEDQTICIKVTTDNVADMEMLLDCLF